MVVGEPGLDDRRGEIEFRSPINNLMTQAWLEIRPTSRESCADRVFQQYLRILQRSRASASVSSDRQR